jgi:hypothetical protein
VNAEHRWVATREGEFLAIVSSPEVGKVVCQRVSDHRKGGRIGWYDEMSNEPQSLAELDDYEGEAESDGGQYAIFAIPYTENGMDLDPAALSPRL